MRCRRILEFAGYDVVRANYPGDIGLHVIKWLWNYMKFHSGERPEKDITRWMGSIYAEANHRLEENPELEAEVRALYARWDRRDPEVVALWEETRQWSLDGFNEMYDLLDIRFDRYYFNSMAEQPGKEVVEELIAKGIAQDERPDGPVIVKLDELLGLKKEKYRVLVVLRSDSTALYATEDLALAKMKFSDYPDLVKSLVRGGCAPVAALPAGFQDAGTGRVPLGRPLPAYPLRAGQPARQCGDGIARGHGGAARRPDPRGDPPRAGSGGREEPRAERRAEDGDRPARSALGRSSTPCWRARIPRSSPLIGKPPWISTARPRLISSMPYVRANSILRKAGGSSPAGARLQLRDVPG